MHTVYIAYLELVSATLIGFVSKAASTPMINLMCPSHLASALLVLVYFYKVYSNTLDICLLWILSRCPVYTVSRDQILGVPLIYFVQACFSCCTFRIPRRFRFCPLDWRLVSGSSCPYVLCFTWRISEILGRKSLRLKRFPRKSGPCLWVFVS